MFMLLTFSHLVPLTGGLENTDGLLISPSYQFSERRIQEPTTVIVNVIDALFRE